MRRNTASTWVLPLLILLAFAGAVIGMMLTSFHLTHGRAPWRLFHVACGRNNGGCADVLESHWAVLPGGSGIPVSALGVAYFGGLSLWYLAVGLANRRGRIWQALPLAAQIASVIVSLFFIVLMVTRIHAICWWCAMSHAINFVLLFLAWKAWPREDNPGDPPRPAARLAFAGLLLVATFAALTAARVRLGETRTAAVETEKYAQTIRQDMDLQRYLFFRQPVHPMTLRPDDPVRGIPNAEHTVIVFSDFQCPECRDFAQFTESKLRPRFGDRLRIIYRHFPLEPECNKSQDDVSHELACEASYAAEAARVLGGNDAFWKMHDLLFARQESLTKDSWAELGKAAGLDGAAVAERVAHHEAQARIQEDAAAGAAIRLEYTPTVLLDGREVVDWSRLEIWQALLAGAAKPAPLAAGQG
jgi:protein-disulfide isomerase/uncharacterized membrane protein